MPTITLDYETYYKKKEYSVKDLGNWRYCHDDRFDPYLLSVWDGSEGWVGDPKNFNWDSLNGSTLIAHNAGFERAVTGRLVELGQAPASVLDQEWHCTANMTSYLCGERALANAVKVLEKRNLDKGVRDEMNGRNWAQAVEAGLADKLAQYALDDSKEAHALWTKYSHLWPQNERDLSELTMRQCSRGVQINVELLEQYRVILQEVIFNLERSLPWTERGAKPTSPKAIAEQCRIVGIPAPPVKTHDEEGFIVWEATYGPKYSWVYAAGQWRSLGKLLSSLDTIKERLRPDNTIDFSLLYFGGHTGRWSGGGSGLNFQNFRKVPIYIKDMRLVIPPDGLSAKESKDWVAANTDYQLDIRKLLIPRPGKKFILSDLSQIEPRVLAWLTGNQVMLDLLASGMSIYEAFARVSMSWRGGVLKKENPEMYNLAKIQVLGLGYGCGWEKFITIAAGYGVNLVEAESRQIVTTFREQNTPITDLWNKLDNAFRRSVNSDFVMELPSGRAMTYRNVLRTSRLKKDRETGKFKPTLVYTAEIGSDRCELYGGLLTENLVQAASRDVFGEHVLNLENNLGDCIWTVHDEAIMEVDPDVTTKDVEALMSVTPEWIPGLPVTAEAQEAPHYMK